MILSHHILVIPEKSHSSLDNTGMHMVNQVLYSLKQHLLLCQGWDFSVYFT